MHVWLWHERDIIWNLNKFHAILTYGGYCKIDCKLKYNLIFIFSTYKSIFEFL